MVFIKKISIINITILIIFVLDRLSKSFILKNPEYIRVTTGAALVCSEFTSRVSEWISLTVLNHLVAVTR